MVSPERGRGLRPFPRPQPRSWSSAWDGATSSRSRVIRGEEVPGGSAPGAAVHLETAGALVAERALRAGLGRFAPEGAGGFETLLRQAEAEARAVRRGVWARRYAGAFAAEIFDEVRNVSSFDETGGHPFDDEDGDPDAARPAIHARPGLPAGEWYLVGPLGAGGFGTVWLAEHRALFGRRAALKIPHDRRALARVRQDGLVQARLDAPEIVRVIGLDADSIPPYVADELVEGGTLAGRLPLPPARALAVLADVAAALAHAHARAVLHLDLKPANILLDRRGRARVTDFGFGPDSASPATALGLSAGLDSAPPAATVAYMAPEQRLPGLLDARADIYSFGMVLFEATVGRLPTGLERPREANPALPPLIDELYERCCAPLERRIGNGDELLEALDAGGVPLSAAVRGRLARRRTRAPIAWRERSP